MGDSAVANPSHNDIAEKDKNANAYDRIFMSHKETSHVADSLHTSQSNPALAKKPVQEVQQIGATPRAWPRLVNVIKECSALAKDVHLLKAGATWHTLKPSALCFSLALLTNHLHVVDADGKPGHFCGIVEDGHRQPAEAHVAGPDVRANHKIEQNNRYGAAAARMPAPGSIAPHGPEL
eukprot:CAMPEP_0181431860 /NCGR_PEP_ID=MMETSP1110-20121109/18471_1 /TAXON_ID=174948 /ORGANISM="Symbiodinium sp., Strain CCMP421" /LENGTH=178 /DNA_ID=CAMNT_0023555249 /DNA_START=341 /DNA_END=877 /DNA_ORIENTATION=+